MPPSLLRTQLDDLEERQVDEPGVTVDITMTPEKLVDEIIAAVADGNAVEQIGRP
jgi:gluconate kinase